MKVSMFFAVVLLFCLSYSCRKSFEQSPSTRVWTIAELKALQGKTRDEIKEALGAPSGLYTYDAKGRWHYPTVLVSLEGAREPKRMSVMVYFSQFGEHRSTIVEVVDRPE
jgi:outer membrane protein assembly factor BamE (lipoprotein component of BamABCDE complex)